MSRSFDPSRAAASGPGRTARREPCDPTPPAADVRRHRPRSRGSGPPAGVGMPLTPDEMDQQIYDGSSLLDSQVRPRMRLHPEGPIRPPAWPPGKPGHPPRRLRSPSSQRFSSLIRYTPTLTEALGSSR